MKKILSLLFLASVLGIVACDNEDPAPAAPTISIDPATVSDLPGATVTVTASVVAPGGAKTLTVTGGINQTVALAGETSIDKQVDLVIPASAVVGSSISAVFSVQDNSNQSSVPVSLTITVGNPVKQLAQVTANTTLVASTKYLIKGQVFVKSGATLTIPAGTILMGDKATKGTLVIEPGGKLVANGTVDNPIVFTSSQVIGARDKGDWGGIVWLGNAFVNQTTRPTIEGISPTVNYGTNSTSDANAGGDANTADNGSLKYARIEYAGIELTPNNETNGLTMGALGSATVIDFVQSSYGGDDAFEWFGGTVNAKHLVSLATWDDDFDTDFGWRGMVQWGVAVRAAFSADQSGSTSFESDSQGNANMIGSICDGTAVTGCTRGVFSNITVLGPRDYTRGLSGNYTRAMHIRRRTAISIFNTVITGYPTGLTMDDAGTVLNYTAGAGVFKNNVMFVPILPTSAGNEAPASGNAFYTTNTASIALVTDFWEAAAANVTVKGEVVKKANNDYAGNWAATAVPGDHIIYPYENYWPNTYPFYAGSTTANYPSNPAFAITTGNLVGLVPANLFPGGSKVDNAFFDKTLTYKGAFGGTDWTDSWAEFQPLNRAY